MTDNLGYVKNHLFNRIDKILIILSILFGSLLLFFPIHYILLLGLVGFTLLYFFVKPDHCYYLLIFTIPFTERLRILPISFSLNDIIVMLAAFVLIIYFAFDLRNKRVNLNTRLDIWIIILLILYFYCGFTSEGETGILSSFKFLEAVICFYLTVYFIRIKEVKISNILKAIVVAALFQSLLGILQSFTGSFGALYYQNRGYLGYLGLGSSGVWQGQGTMGHFNMLGNFLITNLLFFLPINHFLIKNKKMGTIIISILLTGIITTYSRGSLLGLYFGLVYFFFATTKEKWKFGLNFGTSVLIIGMVENYLKHTSYVDTLSPRNHIWDAVIAAILSNPKYIWIGAGLNSYENVVWQFMPPKDIWFAHNYYLLCVQEMGIIGFVIMFSFLIFILIDTWNRFKTNLKFIKALNLSIGLCVLSIFFVSIFDHAYSLTFFKIFLFVILGIIYAENDRFSKKLY